MQKPLLLSIQILVVISILLIGTMYTNTSRTGLLGENIIYSDISSFDRNNNSYDDSHQTDPELLTSSNSLMNFENLQNTISIQNAEFYFDSWYSKYATDLYISWYFEFKNVVNDTLLVLIDYYWSFDNSSWESINTDEYNLDLFDSGNKSNYDYITLNYEGYYYIVIRAFTNDGLLYYNDYYLTENFENELIVNVYTYSTKISLFFRYDAYFLDNDFFEFHFDLYYFDTNTNIITFYDSMYFSAYLYGNVSYSNWGTFEIEFAAEWHVEVEAILSGDLIYNESYYFDLTFENKFQSHIYNHLDKICYYWNFEYFFIDLEPLEIIIYYYYWDGFEWIFWDQFSYLTILNGTGYIYNQMEYTLPFDGYWIVNQSTYLGDNLIYSDSIDYELSFENFFYSSYTILADTLVLYLGYLFYQMDDKQLDINISIYQYEYVNEEWKFYDEYLESVILNGSDYLSRNIEYTLELLEQKTTWLVIININLSSDQIHYQEYEFDILRETTFNYYPYQYYDYFSLCWEYSYFSIEETLLEVKINFYYFDINMNEWLLIEAFDFVKSISGSGYESECKFYYFPYDGTWMVNFVVSLDYNITIYDEFIYNLSFENIFNLFYYTYSNVIEFNWWYDYYSLDGELFELTIEFYYWDETVSTWEYYDAIVYSNYLYGSSNIGGYYIFELPFKAQWQIEVKQNLNFEVLYHQTINYNYLDLGYYEIHKDIIYGFNQIWLDWNVFYDFVIETTIKVKIEIYIYDDISNYWNSYDIVTFSYTLSEYGYLYDYLSYYIPYDGDWLFQLEIELAGELVISDTYFGSFYSQYLDIEYSYESTISTVNNVLEISYNLYQSELYAYFDFYYLNEEGEYIYYDTYYSYFYLDGSETIVYAIDFIAPFTAYWEVYLSIYTVPDHFYGQSNVIPLINPTEIDLSITGFGDVTFTSGDLGNVIIWEIGAYNFLLHNYVADYHGYYEIIGGGSAQNGDWNLQTNIISYNVDYLTPGTYEFTLLITDQFGNTASNTVGVKVLAGEVTTEPTDKTDTTVTDDPPTTETTEPITDDQTTPPTSPALPENPLNSFGFISVLTTISLVIILSRKRILR
jgi:hypothetical protein